MYGLVSLTDQKWFDFLASRAAATEERKLDEVNFWRPRSQRALRSVQPGAPFFLRLKRPHHAIAGYGFFAHWQLVPFAQAWELFGEKNGAPSREHLRQSIASFRGSDPEALGSTPLGCVILRDVVFLDREHWLPWDKVYDLAQAPGDRLLALLRARYDTPVDLADRFQLLDCDQRRHRERRAVHREGQGTFKLRLLDAYGHRCAVTGERVVPVLDAAHIQDYLGPASNHVQNGLLLRTDLHRLYDEGLVTVTPDYEFRVSDRLQDEWANGREYYELAGQRLRATKVASQRASRDALAWHAEQRFG